MTTTSFDIRLATQQQATLIGGPLGQAFHNEPNFAYIIPDDARRRDALVWFFGVFVARLGLRYGRVYTTDDAAGAAVWMAPGSGITPRGAIGAGLFAMPARFGWGGLVRSMRINQRVDRMRQQYAPEPHWYLMALGVAPERQNRGVGTALLQPALSEADATGTACYLETFNERNLAFYRRLGFEVVAEDSVPRGGPRFWGMVRMPTSAAGPDMPNRTVHSVSDART